MMMLLLSREIDKAMEGDRHPAEKEGLCWERERVDGEFCEGWEKWAKRGFVEKGRELRMSFVKVERSELLIDEREREREKGEREIMGD